MTAPTSPGLPDAVVARLKTMAQVFWTVVLGAVASFAGAHFGVDVTGLADAVLVPVVGLSAAVLAGALMWIVSFAGARWPAVKRLWIFVTDPTY